MSSSALFVFNPTIETSLLEAKLNDLWTCKREGRFLDSSECQKACRGMVPLPEERWVVYIGFYFNPKDDLLDFVSVGQFIFQHSAGQIQYYREPVGFEPGTLGKYPKEEVLCISISEIERYPPDMGDSRRYMIGTERKRSRCPRGGPKC